MNTTTPGYNCRIAITVGAGGVFSYAFGAMELDSCRLNRGGEWHAIATETSTAETIVTVCGKAFRASDVRRSRGAIGCSHCRARTS